MFVTVLVQKAMSYLSLLSLSLSLPSLLSLSVRERCGGGVRWGEVGSVKKECLPRSFYGSKLFWWSWMRKRKESLANSLFSLGDIFHRKIDPPLRNKNADKTGQESSSVSLWWYNYIFLVVRVFSSHTKNIIYVFVDFIFDAFWLSYIWCETKTFSIGSIETWKREKRVRKVKE